MIARTRSSGWVIPGSTFERQHVLKHVRSYVLGWLPVCLCCGCATHAPAHMKTSSYVKRPCLLLKLLHCPHSDDLPAPPRGVHPKNLKEGAFTVYQGHFLRFLLNEGAFTPDHALFR